MKLSLVVGVLLVCTACGGGESESAAPTSPSAPAAVPTVPRPTEQQTNALMAGLSQVDLGLAADRDRAVGRARDICLDIKGGTPDADLAQRAVSRFTGGSVPTLTVQQGQAIVQAVRSSFCG